MKITEQQVDYVAALANLSLSREETRRMARDLGEILDHIETLNELDTTGVEPMAQVLYDAGDTATLREDDPRPVLGSETAVANAPAAGGGYFKVPKVIER
ncbi:MAG TPA: Asp-tRNA(Asn)/Glu-tRNA(Gln) amidotransferase subunit GatC [Bryobacteraceae bacterium]|nr:Asp-tRNA(Asn)/Glu-tRNA(Gln) amidotransferase subunit GatC [Bryobacteraceae bacterium]